tara:strand:- start:256 stop:753 length:498 start_codon:yes stop_codon:yes gene_type:complete
MRIIKTKAFLFEELDSQTKEKVIENNRTINVDSNFWYDCELENFKHELKIKVNEFDVYRTEINITIENSFETAQGIVNFFGKESSIVYSAKTFIRDMIFIEEKYEHDGEKLEEELEYLEEEFRGEIAEEILSMLTSQYEYETSDDEIKETIIANEYEFTEDGEML